MWLRSMCVTFLQLVAEYDFPAMIVGGFHVRVFPLVPGCQQQYPIGVPMVYLLMTL